MGESGSGGQPGANIGFAALDGHLAGSGETIEGEPVRRFPADAKSDRQQGVIKADKRNYRTTTKSFKKFAGLIPSLRKAVNTFQEKVAEKDEQGVREALHHIRTILENNRIKNQKITKIGICFSANGLEPSTSILNGPNNPHGW